MDSRVPCLDPEVVAAYLDRQLAVSERQRLEEHVAACGECASLVAESIRTLGDLPERIPVHGPSTRIPVHGPVAHRSGLERSYWGALAAAATIVAMLSAPSLFTRWQSSDPRLADLAEAAGERRAVEGRLTGGFPHAPLPAPLAGGQGGATVETVRLELAAGRIREDINRRTTPERLHALGVSQVLLGRYDDAAFALSAAVREQPANARYLNDLATVYLERARRGLRADDLPRALAAAERAVRLDPALNEAWFNRALALSALSLRDRARRAWADYLRRDSSSPWAREARAHLADASDETPTLRWRTVETQLRQNVTASIADEAVRLQMSNARRFVESELLPAWANAATAGADATGAREALRVLADAFSRVAGDDLYRDAVAAIDRAESRGVAELRQLAAAHRQYAEAQGVFAEDRFADAAPGLTAAFTGLTASRSAFAQRVAIDLVAVSYVSGQTAQALQSLDAIAVAARASRHAYVSARVSWFRGLIAFGQGRPSDARARYEDTLSAFEETGDTEQAAGAHVLLASLHDYLGDASAAWMHRAAALEGIEGSGPSRFRYGLLIGAAGAALKQQDLEAALILQDAVLDNARAINRPAAMPEALAQRAAILRSLGRHDEAAAAAAAARSHLDAVRDGGLRDRLEGVILQSEASAEGVAASAAAGAAERGIALIESRNDRARLPQFYLALGRARGAAGLATAAARAAESGIAAFERENARSLVANSDDGWQLYGLAARLALDRGDRDAAFDWADRARARGLRAVDVPRLAPQDVERRLQPDEAVLALNQFEDELVLWLVRPSGTVVVRRPLTRRDAVRLTGRFDDEVALGSAPAAAGALFNEIIRPFAGDLAGVEHLVIVPDSTYGSVAFPGLWDNRSRRFLIESQTLALTSSLASFDRDAGPRRPPGDGFVEIGGPVPADAALRLLSGVPERAVVRVSAPARSHGDYPLRSRVQFADLPGQPYSGMVLMRDVAALDLSRSGVLLLSNLEDGGSLTLASTLLASGAASVVGPSTALDDGLAVPLFDELRATIGREASVAAGVASLQRDVLRRTGHRLGAWSKLMVYGPGR